MVIAEKPLDAVLPWDAFLEKEVDKQGLHGERREQRLRALREQIDGFRRMEWLNLKRIIAKQTKWVIPDGLEPHWVGSGKAIFWQEQRARVRQQRLLSDGSVEFYIEEVVGGWAPSSVLPCNSASQIGQWLDLGLRLRPPAAGVAEVLIGPAEATGPAPELPPLRLFWCRRHPEKGLLQFSTWKAYLRHCQYFKEAVVETPPPEVVEAARSWKYYCLAHNKGFNYKNLAARHVKSELRKPGRAAHQTVEQMEV